jgi:hypothetical protein
MITRTAINAIQAKLATVFVTATNSRQKIQLKAPEVAKYPTGLSTAQLPLALTWPGPSTFDFEGIGGGKRRFMQSLTTIVYMQPLGQNDIPSRADESLLMLDAVRNILLDNTAIVDSNYQVTLAQDLSNPHRDSGLRGDLQFGGTVFFGFTVDIRLRILRAN